MDHRQGQVEVRRRLDQPDTTPEVERNDRRLEVGLVRAVDQVEAVRRAMARASVRAGRSPTRPLPAAAPPPRRSPAARRGPSLRRPRTTRSRWPSLPRRTETGSGARRRTSGPPGSPADTEARSRPRGRTPGWPDPTPQVHILPDIPRPETGRGPAPGARSRVSSDVIGTSTGRSTPPRSRKASIILSNRPRADRFSPPSPASSAAEAAGGVATATSQVRIRIETREDWSGGQRSGRVREQVALSPRGNRGSGVPRTQVKWTSTPDELARGPKIGEPRRTFQTGAVPVRNDSFYTKSSGEERSWLFPCFGDLTTPSPS